MSIDPGAELPRFQQFIADHLRRGADLSPEEALDLWRAENPNAEDFADTVQAIRQAIVEMDAGDKGMSVNEFDVAFRRRHDLPSPS